MRAIGTAPASLLAPETLEALLGRARATPPGCFVEVGVWQGGSAWHLEQLAREQWRAFYAYDTFQGMPHAIEGLDSHKVGDFNGVTYQEIRTLLRYHQSYVIMGTFPKCARPMGPIAFVHLDCDQYQSYAEALAYLDPLMVPGGVIWCDDVPCLAGAKKALDEYASRTGRQVHVAEKAFIQF